jgi:hypothetical protein
MQQSSSYGNSDASSGVIDLGDEGGVIGFGDCEGGVIGFGDCEGGVIGFGDCEGGVIGDVVVVSLLIDFGRPQTSDSVELTNASFGLLGSHIFAFISGDMVVLSEPGGDGGGGGGGAKGIKGDMNGDCCSSC